VPLIVAPAAVDDPALRKYHFSVSGKQVVVADPETRRILRVNGE